MRVGRRISLLGAGLLAGLVAALLMTLLMVVGRDWLGISPPPEAVSDRLAPTLDIKTFFDLFGKYGGYNGLKKFGIRSGLEGVFGLGAVMGILYAAIAESRRSRAASRWRIGSSPYGLLFVGIGAAVLWIGTVIFLWPVLAANFRGLPPSRARLASAGGLLIYYVGYGLTLIATYRFVVRRVGRQAADESSETDESAEPSAAATVPVPAPVPVGQIIGRRAVAAGVAGALLALPSYRLLQRLYDRAAFSYDGRPYSGPGIQPIAPNDAFYSVTKNVVDPNVTKSFWRLEITGLVDQSKRFSFDDLASLPTTEQETTLMCISNRIGAGLFSNAVWKGVPLRDLLTAAGVKKGAVEVKLHAADGYTDTFAIEKAMEPATLVAYLMNGEPLSEKHGYPARVIVPGLFGEKNVKWVTSIEVIDHDGKGFYEQQGWGPNFTIPTRSDFFAPQTVLDNSGFHFRDPFKLNQATTLCGRTFAGDRGVTKVEISLDGGTSWLPTRIDYPGTHLTWSFWSYVWRPTEAGMYQVTSRATDGTGAVQKDDARDIVPQGASGYHRLAARVQG